MNNSTFRSLRAQILIMFLFFGSCTLSSIAQVTPHNHDEDYPFVGKRIKINQPTSDQLVTITQAGIDLKCGAEFVNNVLYLELDEGQIAQLDQFNVNYTIVIEDLISFHNERNATALPLAIQNLEEQKRNVQNPIATRSLSTGSTTISNVIQYEGEVEENWAVPQNFTLGSMGGCLTYSEMLSQLDQMRALYPNLISIKKDASLAEDGSGTPITTHGNNLGATTWDPQTIYYVRISDNPDTDESNEPESFYSGMTHSREVSSLMNLMYYMWYILENYDTDPDVRNLVDNNEMYFVPVSNPDGLRWNETQAPNGGGLQRKNLEPNSNPGNNFLRGVDLNRNYSYLWGSAFGGSSGSTNSDTYRGVAPFSEPETRIIEQFVANHDVKTALNHHATSNLLPHGYNGEVGAPPSGREDDYAQFCQDLTRFNRYIYGEAPNILTVANGDMSDWMLGGPVRTNSDGSTSIGSGKEILALAPENGDPSGLEANPDFNSGFWPSPDQIVYIAQRAMRMNFVNALYAGKTAQLHDMTPSNLTTTSGTLDFGIEYLGMTLSDLTLTVTPVSTNINSIGTLPTQTGFTKQEQRQVSINYTLGSVAPDDPIEYEVTLSNDTNIVYQATIIKYFTPGELFTDNPDVDGLSNWTASSDWGTTTDGFNGSTGITNDPTPPYANNRNATLTLNNTIDLSAVNTAVIQFYAKWDIERNFDYAQLQASTDGGATWNALHGKYTKPGATLSTTRYSPVNGSGSSSKTAADRDNQPNGKALYEGFNSNKWVLEEIEISAAANSFITGASSVQLRFVFDSDSNNNADGYTTSFDGFTFDDFKILSYDVDRSCLNGVIDEFVYEQSFEAGLGLWTQNSEDDGNLTLGSGETPSSNTGPTAASNGNYYYFVEASSTDIGVGSNAEVILTSPCIDLNGGIIADFDFDYHMFGADTGSLVLQVSPSTTSNWTTVFTRTGAQSTNGGDWQSGAVDLSTYTDTSIQLRFVITTGNGFASDIAIDNFSINPSDTENPVASCLNITVNLGADGLSVIQPEDIDDGSTDNVGIDSLTIDIDSFTCEDVGNNNVTLTVTDFAGNSDTCVAIVTVAPYTTPPANPTVSNITGTSAILNWEEAASGEYTVRFRESGTTTFATLDETTNTVTLSGLSPTTTYEAQVRANCATGNTPFSTLLTFSTTEFCTGVTINSFPYSEGFNINIGDWTQNTDDSNTATNNTTNQNSDWTIDGDGTVSSDTGPSAPAEGVDYIYLESSDPTNANVTDPNAVGFNATVIITSPCIDLTGYELPELSYQYHMYGNTMGTLDTQISEDGGASWNSLLGAIYSGDLGDQWNSETIDLSLFSGKIIQIRFVGVTGNGFRSDMALDDVGITATAVAGNCIATTTYTSTGWDNGIPNDTTSAIIASDYNTALQGLGSITACELTVNTGATLTVGDDTFIHVQNDITVNGALAIHNTANVVQVAQEATTINNGTITVDKTTPSLNPRDFIVLSSPMSGESKTGVYDSANRVFGIIPNNFVPNPDVSAAFPMAANFIDDNGDYLDNAITNLEISKGYIVFPQAVNATNAVTYNHTYTQGTLNSGDVITPIHYNSTISTDNFNLLGNPYASALDTDMLIASNDAINEVYFWEHITTPSQNLPGFNTANISMDDVSVRNAMMGIAAVNDISGAAPGQYMASGQGFGILANGTEAGNQTPVIFTNALRVTGNNSTPRSSEWDNKIWLQLTTQNYDIQSTAAIGFIPEATPGFDTGYDSRQLATSISLFSTLENGEQLAIQGREIFDPEMEISIGFQTLIEEQERYTISINALEGIELEDVNIYLTDNVTGIVTNLKESNYSFETNQEASNNRFSLSFEEDTLSLTELSNNKLRVYPNPTKSTITLYKQGDQNLKMLIIRDMLGKIIRTQDITSFNEEQIFDISALNNGIYFFQIISDTSSESIRVIKH